MEVGPVKPMTLLGGGHFHEWIGRSRFRGGSRLNHAGGPRQHIFGHHQWATRRRIGMGIAAAHARCLIVRRLLLFRFCRGRGRSADRPLRQDATGANIEHPTEQQPDYTPKTGQAKPQHNPCGQAQRRCGGGQNRRQMEMNHQRAQRLGARGQTAQAKQRGKPQAHKARKQAMRPHSGLRRASSAPGFGLAGPKVGNFDHNAGFIPANSLRRRDLPLPYSLQHQAAIGAASPLLANTLW